MKNAEQWPPLRYDDWKDTCETLHMWFEVVGKIRMATSPPINHWWHVPLYVTARGLGTGPMPYEGRYFEIDFDFLDHKLAVSTSDGEHREFKLHPMTVSEFYARVMTALSEMAIEIEINTMPSEVENPIRFEEDLEHKSYDAAAADRFWRVLVQACRVFTEFRSRFIGKVSPVHFFWGAVDLAVTRFSGNKAPLHPGAPGLPLAVVREAYSHEVSSAGFWPGGGGAEAAFYSYAYPEPEGYRDAKIEPAAAAYSDTLREFLLPYDAVRTSESPDETLMQFLQSTYDAAANLAKWNRAALER